MSIVTRFAAVTAAFALAPLAGAQPVGKIVITPYVGVYAPNTTLAKLNVAGEAISLAASAEHKTGLALGATGSYWFVPRVGIEVGALYAFSDVSASFAVDEQNEPLDAFGGADNAGMILATTKLMVGLFPPSSDFQLRFGVGPAIITRVGSAYKSDAEGEITGRTDFGAAMSLCTKVPIGSGIALRLRVEDYMYQAKLGYEDKLTPADSYTFDKRFQHDFVLSVGLQIGLLR